MAKITVADGTVFEGTPAEIVEMARAFEVSRTIKKGDKVRIIGPSIFGVDHVGEIGIFDGIDSDGDHSVIFEHLPQRLYKRENIELVTEEETEADAIERKRNAIFTENGRKVNEYREGDIGRVIDNHCARQVSVGDIVEVRSQNGDRGSINDSIHGYSLTIEPIVFAESRLDRK